MSSEPPDPVNVDAAAKLAGVVHDAIAQELATAATYAQMLAPSEATTGVRLQIARAQERMRLLLRSAAVAEPSPDSEPAVVADLLTDWARAQQQVHIELSYIMDARLVLPPAVREVLFIFLREQLNDLLLRAAGRRIHLLVQLDDGVVTCSLEHTLDDIAPIPGLADRLSAMSGRFEQRPRYSAVIVPLSSS